MHARAAALILLGACASACRKTPPAESAPDAAAPVVQADAASASVSASAAKAPPPPARWETRPPDEAELYVALDGPCPQTALWPLADGMAIQLESRILAFATKAGFDLEPRGPPRNATGSKATSSCPRSSKIAPNGGEWEKIPASFPKAEAVLAKHEGLPSHIEPIAVGPRSIAGVRAGTLEKANAVSDALKKELRLEPEIVCADPR